MKLLDMPRGTGKTTLLKYLSKKNNVPIVVCNQKQKFYIKMKNPTIEIYTYEEFLKLGVKPKRVYIDEVFGLLNQLFKGTTIDIVTFSREELEKDEDLLYFKK